MFNFAFYFDNIDNYDMSIQQHNQKEKTMKNATNSKTLKTVKQYCKLAAERVPFMPDPRHGAGLLSVRDDLKNIEL